MDVIDLDLLKRSREMKKKFKVFIIPLAALVIIIICAVVVKNFYMEIIQLDEIGGLSSVFWTNIGWKAASFVAGWLVTAAALFATGLFANRSIRAFRRAHEIDASPLPVILPAIGLGFFGGLLISQDFYIKALQFLNATPFDKVDPLFSLDIGYYVFKRPFYISIYSFISGLSLFLVFYALAYYLIALMGRDQLALAEIMNSQAIIAHNVINLAMYVAIRIFSYKFTKESLLYSRVVNNAGAGYTDVNIMLRYYTVAPFLLIVVLAASIFFLLRRDMKKALLSFTAYPAVYIITALIAAAVQFLVVNPNEYNKEKPYLEYNIKYTREAYGLDKAQKHSFPEMKILTPDAIARNRNIIDNVRVVDIDSTISNNRQLQSNTNFYSFKDGDILIYEIGNKETPVFTSAREVDQNRIPDKSYINTKYKYTHGYGVVMSFINKITPQGQVEYVMSGLRMRLADESLALNQPRIYYGELTNGQVIVHANGIDEIDYDGNESYRYSGNGGIKLNMLNRLLFAIENQDLNLITSNYVKDATLLLNRNIVARAQKAFPFLYIDPDAYIVLTDDGRLMWVLDAMTRTDQYPYSQRSSIINCNYVRNSVKVAIDAYNGDTTYYIIDPDDPIIKTYAKIYPGIFRNEPLPVSLQKHNRFPETLFDIKAEILRRYHLDENDSAMFYSQQDLWAIARKIRSQRSDDTEDIDSYYNLLMLPSGLGEREELILMLPFTPSGENKNNLVSWLAVRNNYAHYGETIIFEFPKNTNIFGPYQAEIKINQIDKIASDMTLWSQAGTDVYKGNLLVIPIENSILYVEPIYIRAAGTSSIPEVREIVVGYQDGDEFIYGIGRNLEEALNDLSNRGGGRNGGAASGSAGGRGVSGAEKAGASEKGGAGAGDSQAMTQEEREATIAELMDKYDELQSMIDSLGKLIEKLQ